MAEATSTLRIRAHAKLKIRHYIDFILDLHASSSPDDAQGSPMEVALHAEHYGLPFFNPFAHVRPLSGELDGGSRRPQRPVFMGNTISYPKRVVTCWANFPNTEL